MIALWREPPLIRAYATNLGVLRASLFQVRQLVLTGADGSSMFRPR